ncbi:C69 family dipeptidase [Bifidobacterium criceti]|uniref:Dipeptidase n=1 Tax=Bifidobacterium criceti TaxID=1960969 RepID=A0A2A2EGB2_9BIFI|nr:C69 family dipeptidase [Bifidobacterium criceti]PAU68027.1 Dipeptidase [Bifidobacterium criceti]
MACTTILVGRGASYDGSTIIARNEDDEPGSFNNKKLIIVRPEDQPCTYTSVNGHLTIDLPDDPLQYSQTPNAFTSDGVWGEAGINEANVAMTATETITSNARVLGADPLVPYTPAVGKPGDADYVPEAAGGIGEEDLVTIVLPYIRTAREGVKRLGALLEKYGTYESNGIGFSDAHEVWWIETVGGHHWIARRVPDDCYVVNPNRLGIDEFDFEDAYGEQRDYMCSADLREFMDVHHLNVDFALEGRFDPRDAFGSHSDMDHVYNTPRAWMIEKYFNPLDETWDGPDADVRPDDDDIPWCRQPDKKITIEDVDYALSLHYQGTQYDPYGKRGDATTRHMYRPAGINRTCERSIMQIRPYAPQADRAIHWITFASTPFNATVPFFANVDAMPAYVSNTTPEVTLDSYYWASRLLAVLGDSDYAGTAEQIAHYKQTVAALGHQMVFATDEQLARLGGDATYDAAARGTKDEELGIPADVEPVEPKDITDVTRNAQAREVLAAANDATAKQLKAQTQTIIAQCLQATSVNMKNAFSMADF